MALRTIFKDCVGKVYKLAFRVLVWWLMEDFVIVSPEQFRKSFLDEVVRNERLISIYGLIKGNILR
jgi:hypothetical protein